MKTLIAGIGSTILGDDGIGVYAARQLKERLFTKEFPLAQARLFTDDVDIVELGTAGLSLLDLAEGYDRLIVIDAIKTGAPAGTVHELEGDQVTRAIHLGTGHEADLPTTISLGRKLLGRHMPGRITVVAVEVKNTTVFSEVLTPEVEAAVPDVLEKVQELLSVSPE